MLKTNGYKLNKRKKDNGMKKYLVIGLGSMGKRRIRCLQALGIDQQNIWGMDARKDRCLEAKEKYNVAIANIEENIDFSEIRAIIVSLPPNKHFEGVEIAIKHNKPVFVEASVILKEVNRIKERNTENIFIAPSCTFLFHPVVRKIKEIIESKTYGKICNFSYHRGQYLPDWHPWENVREFYVGNRETGGAREIVPYELTWITSLFGYPKEIKGYFRKTMDLDCDIEDSYVCSLDYANMVGSLLVDVVGRNALRNLVINFEYAQLQWRCDRNQLEIYDSKSNDWKSIEIGRLIHEKGYSKNINENMYIDEIKSFLDGIENAQRYPNTIDKDLAVLRLLEELEDSDGGFERDKK